MPHFAQATPGGQIMWGALLLRWGRHTLVWAPDLATTDAVTSSGLSLSSGTTLAAASISLAAGTLVSS